MALLKRKRAGLSDPMSVVTRFVNACNRHDADGVFSCLHPNFDSIQPMYPSRNFRGADQVRRNWQAIFDAEPGFRLTVLRSAVQDDIVWLELHGAGREAEVAGVFVMGIQGDRIRWARIYSALVEAVPGMADDGASSQQVAAGNGEVRDESAIAPVVDIERSSRRRRRSRRREGATPEDTPVTEEAAAEPQAVAVTEAAPEPAAEAATVQEPGVTAEAEVVVVVSPDQDAEAQPAEEATAAHDMAAELQPQPEAEPEPEPEPVVIATEPEPEPVVIATEPDAVPEAAVDTDDEPPKWRFGRKTR